MHVSTSCRRPIAPYTYMFAVLCGSFELVRRMCLLRASELEVARRLEVTRT